MSELRVVVLTLDESSPHLSQVINLADRNAKWLGFYPAEAFRRNAREGKILAAVERGANKLLGYILYFVSRDRAVLQQICVVTEYRQHGVARCLVSALIERTRHLRGISLHCARDFPMHAHWPKLGFRAAGEKIGRGKDRKVLTRFWYDHGHPDLFSNVSEKVASTTHCAVVDANVFFDLHDASRPHYKQAAALQADWLQDGLSLWATDELFNEINRQVSSRQRKASWAAADLFLKIEADPVIVSAHLSHVCELIGPGATEPDRSDRRQLATAIAVGASFFVTRDGGLLASADLISDRLGVRIASPTQLIVHFDELRREADYAPARLAGSASQIQKVPPGELPRVGEAFLAHGLSEKKHAFNDTVSEVLADPSRGEAVRVLGEDGQPIGLMVTDKRRQREQRIRLLRTTGHPLASTVARHLVMRAIRHSLTRGWSLTSCEDPYVSAHTMQALRELGFLRCHERWFKLNLNACDSAPSLLETMRSMSLPEEGAQVAVRLLGAHLEASLSPNVPADGLAHVEHMLYPARILDDRIENYIVPIQERWAIHLFDEDLAARHLLAVDDSLALRCENVYYRDATARLPTLPSHVIWYVTGTAKGRSHKPRAIRACSNVCEVVVDTPGELFRRFSRLGVFRWEHLRELAGDDLTRDLLAFKFRGTTLFTREVKRRRLDEVIRRHTGAVPPLSMPVRIPPACFKELYESGTRTG